MTDRRGVNVVDWFAVQSFHASAKQSGPYRDDQTFDVYLRWPLSRMLPELARERIAEAVSLREAQQIALTRCPAGARPIITDHPEDAS